MDMISIEVVDLKEEINVVGLSYIKLGLPGTLESLEQMWNIYNEKYRGRVENAAASAIDYGVSACILTNRHEYIAGCAVTEIGVLANDWASFTVPPGKYIKFGPGDIKSVWDNHGNIKTWAKSNGVALNGDFEVEVYPDGVNGAEMYILQPIAE